jgi:hypothetical protein
VSDARETIEHRTARFRRRVQPMPVRREIPYARRFDPSELERLRAGLTPRGMEDKWIAFVEGDLLRLARSWTGICVFEVPLALLDDGHALAEHAFANREAVQYEGDDAYDAALLRFLVENLLLGGAGPFPVPPGEAPTPAGGHGLLQHHLAGTGYPEVDLATFHAWHARADRHGG